MRNVLITFSIFVFQGLTIQILGEWGEYKKFFKMKAIILMELMRLPITKPYSCHCLIKF